MTATHILARWRRVRGVLKSRQLWFTILAIAEAGEDGIKRTDLAEVSGAASPSLTHSCKKLIAAGIITERLGERTNGRMPPTISTITPKGLDFLGLKPSNKKTA